MDEELRYTTGYLLTRLAMAVHSYERAKALNVQESLLVEDCVESFISQELGERFVKPFRDTIDAEDRWTVSK